MNFVIETDLGGDPDDFFAICYLISAGAQIRLINLSPGSMRQVAIARFICRRLGLDIPIGVTDKKPEAKQRDDMHYRLLTKNNASLSEVADGRGDELSADHPSVKGITFRGYIQGSIREEEAYLITISQQQMRTPTVTGQ